MINILQDIWDEDRIYGMKIGFKHIGSMIRIMGMTTSSVGLSQKVHHRIFTRNLRVHE